ncbi:5'-nucleotidase C-terminal domain-containing protein [Clostridium sp.]|uniref:5'-nucleotidase C-terminal domain-containing protein n=1 Tax=Clostridium sp. TaxID=1506 RepID=UPI003F41B385
MIKKSRKLLSMLVALTLTVGLVTPAKTVNAVNNEKEEKEIILEVENDKALADDTSVENVKIEVLGTTDLHGKFKNFEYATTSEAAGGLNQIAAVVKEERKNNNNVILLDNGDTIQGNYNHLFLTKEYLSENMNPIALGLKEIGYDAFALGNHEFNYGMDVLNTIVSQVENDKTSVLCANLYKDGERVFKPYVIKEFEGVKVAVIGVVTNHITKWDADKLVGYNPTNPAEEVRKVIDELKSKNEADMFVVSAHMGLTPEYGDGDSATDIANLNPEVAMILAGHSHATIKEEIVNGVLITQPKNNGSAVSKVELEVEKTEEGTKIVNRSVEHIVLEKNSPVDAELDAKLDNAHQIALNDATSSIGTLVGEDLAEANEVKGIPQSFVSDQGVTDLINEVQLYYSAKHLESLGIDASKEYHVSGAAMLSSSANLKAGDITKAGLANIYKFDNKLYTIKTTGKQIKKYIEWTAEFYNTFEEGDLTISFDKDFASFKYDMLTGVNYELNLSKQAGSRVENLTFSDNKKVEDTDVVYLTVNDYRYSSNLAPIFDDGEHEKIYESTNDPLSDVRDMIASYIVDVKGGVLERKVDNNWKLTGIKYNEKLRSEVVKLINDGTIKPSESYGIIAEPLTWTEVSRQLTEKGLVDKLEELKALTLKTIDVLSFNDFHGNVLESGKNIGAAKLAGVINKYQSKESDIYGVVPVVAGDAYQGTAISNLTKGEPVNEMIKAIKAKVSAVGNHEFDWDREDFTTWRNQGGFDFVAANIVYKETQELADFVEPYVIVENNGVKIAFIGIATTDTPVSTKAEKVEDLDFLDPVETLNKWSPIARAEGADVVVALTHSGATEAADGTITGEAADMAREASDVDAVIASHNHKFVDGYVVNNEGRKIPVVQGGYNGRGLARLRFTFDSDNNLTDVEPYTHIFQGIEGTLPVNEEIAARMAQWDKDLEPLFAEKVAYLENALDHDRNNGLTPLGVTVAEAMRKIGGTQIAIANGGGIRRPLEQGDVTVGDMYEILPFDNQLVTLELKGKDLVKVIEHGINPPSFGWGQFAGLKVWYDEDGKVTSIRLEDGTKIDMEKYYTVTTIDFLITGGDSYDFSNAINVVDTMEVMREGIQAEWKDNGIPVLDYELLVQGEDTTIEKPEIDTKPEVKPEQPSTDDKEEDKNGKLPNTGAPIAPAQVIMFALVAVAAGSRMLKKDDVA